MIKSKLDKHIRTKIKEIIYVNKEIDKSRYKTMLLTIASEKVEDEKE